MSAPVVRTANPADLPGLLDLYAHLDARCSAEEAAVVLDRLGRYAGSAVLVVVAGTALVASCTLVIIPNLTRGGRPYALIENVVTHAAHRRLGYGRMVLAEAIERAWAEGCYKAMLTTGSRSPATLAFYEAAGFEQSRTGFQVRRLAARPG